MLQSITIEYLATSLVVVLVPGTGVLYTLASGLTRGARASVAAALGCTFGILPHIAAAILGLAAVLHTSALLFSIVKYLGVAYLLYMAWCALRESGALKVDDRIDARSAAQIVATGFAINILNPKLSIFFLAFLPQFIEPGRSDTLATMLALSAVFMALTFVVFVLYGLLAATVRDQLLSRRAVMTWVRRVFAGTFVALGLKLAFAER